MNEYRLHYLAYSPMFKSVKLVSEQVP